ELARVLHVGDRGGLGDLEDEAAGVDAGGADLALDQLGQVGIAERAGGQGDLEPEVVVGGAAGQQVDGRADDPAVDLLDQPELLGRLDERGGGGGFVFVARAL